jgi:uncharacterized protein
MTISLYDITVPVFIRNLKTLSKLLDKGLEHVSGNEAVLVESRLAPDMYPLPYQIQRVSDTAKGLVSRIGKTPPVAMEDNEQTFAQLKERIDKTIAVLESVDPGSINGREDEEVVVKMGATEYKQSALDYTLNFAIPNFYFHFCIAYALLRKEGVPVGKADYMGRR